MSTERDARMQVAQQWVDFIFKEERVAKYRAALGAKRDFGSWLETAKTWVFTTAMSGNVRWNAVEPTDIIKAFTSAATLALLVDGEECMVMVRGQRSAQVKCEIGARGVVRLAGAAGIKVQARTIKAGDQIELDEGAGIVHHTPAWLVGEEPGDTRGYYAVAIHRDGKQIVRSLSLADAQSRRPNNWERTPWKSHPDQMGEKSAVLTLRKVLYFGDEIESLISGSGAAMGDTWAYRDTDEFDEPEPEPQEPPASVADKVRGAAAKAAPKKAPAKKAASRRPPEPDPEADGYDMPSDEEWHGGEAEGGLAPPPDGI